MTKRHTAEALRIAKAVRRKKYADGGGATYLFSDKWRDYLAKKGEQVASLPSEVANRASAAWQHPLSQAMRTSPGETSKAIGEYAYDLGKQGVDYASERPFSAARKAIDFATDWSMDPRVMVAKGIFSSTPANAGEDEFARQVQYGIRQAPEAEVPQYDNGGRTGYADGGAPWANVYGNQNDPIFDQLQKDIAAQRNRPLPAIDPLRKNPITSPASAYVKPNVGGDAPVSGDATGGTGDPFTSGGSDSGSSMDSSSSYGTPDGTPNGATFGSNTYGQTYGPTNTGIGMLDNAMNNPGTTAINAGFGLIGGPLGIANTVSGLVGGPTIGGMVTGSYSNPTSMSGTSYSKSSDPTAPAALAAHTAPAAPAEEESDPSAVSAPAVADASPESFGTGLTDGSIGGETGSFGAGPSGISGSAANDGTIGGETGSFGAGIGGFGGGFGDGSIGGETGSFGAGIGGGPDGGPDGGPSGGPDGGPAGDSGPGGDSGDGGSGSSGDGGGGDGGGSGGGDGGSEKRGGLVRSKRHASDSMVKRALKVTDAHGRKSKLRTKKDGSVVKQAVVLASKLAKRQRGRP